MEKNIEIGLLYEFYIQLLTQRQQYIIDSYYNNDLSLSEIAEELNISRQGVQKQIKDAQKALYNYEEKLQLLKKFLKTKKILEEIYIDLDVLGKKYDKDVDIIKSVKNRLKKIN